MTLKHQFPVRDLLIGEKKKNPVSETGSNWGVPGPGGPELGGPWPRGARATPTQKKTLHERELGGSHPKILQTTRNGTQTSISRSCFADRGKTTVSQCDAMEP